MSNSVKPLRSSSAARWHFSDKFLQISAPQFQSNYHVSFWTTPSGCLFLIAFFTCSLSVTHTRNSHPRTTSPIFSPPIKNQNQSSNRVKLKFQFWSNDDPKHNAQNTTRKTKIKRKLSKFHFFSVQLYTITLHLTTLLIPWLCYTQPLLATSDHLFQGVHEQHPRAPCCGSCCRGYHRSSLMKTSNASTTTSESTIAALTLTHTISPWTLQESLHAAKMMIKINTEGFRELKTFRTRHHSGFYENNSAGTKQR